MPSFLDRFDSTPTVWRRLIALYRAHTVFVSPQAYGLAYGAAVGAWFSGGDIIITAPILVIGWIFAAIGISSIVVSWRTRIIWCMMVLILFMMESIVINILHWNDHDIYKSVADMRTQINSMELEQKLSRNPAPLEPGTDPMIGPCDEDQYNLTIGGNDFGAQSLPFTAIAIRNEPFLVISQDKNGGIAASFKLYDKSDRILEEVDYNKVLVPTTGLSYMKARRDLHSIEVADVQGSTRLQIYYANKNNIVIGGVFYRHGKFFDASGSGLTNGNFTLSHVASCSAKIGLRLN